MTSRDGHHEEEGHRTPGAKREVRKTWYDVMEEARAEASNKLETKEKPEEVHPTQHRE